MINLIKMLIGRARYIAPRRVRFCGAYESREEAVKAVPKGLTVGYDNDNVVDLNFELMCEVASWDYPVLYWLRRLLPEASGLLDAGGHMGTKYRAWQQHLDYQPPFEWTIYDVPAVVKAGIARAEQDGLSNLKFTTDLSEISTADIFLGSGLLQYIESPLKELILQIPNKPKYLIFNKVPVRKGPAKYTLENFYSGLVPYYIRNEDELIGEFNSLGYEVMDRWEIPALTHRISTHLEMGNFQNIGYALRQVTGSGKYCR